MKIWTDGQEKLDKSLRGLFVGMTEMASHGGGSAPYYSLLERVETQGMNVFNSMTTKDGGFLPSFNVTSISRQQYDTAAAGAGGLGGMLNRELGRRLGLGALFAREQHAIGAEHFNIDAKEGRFNIILKLNEDSVNKIASAMADKIRTDTMYVLSNYDVPESSVEPLGAVAFGSVADNSVEYREEATFENAGI